MDIRPITEEYFKPFLDAIKKDPYGELFFVDVFTGMRQGEIIGLTWDCVNFFNGTITVKHQLQQIRHRVFFARPKCRKLQSGHVGCCSYKM